jgi:predicted phage tail protein
VQVVRDAVRFAWTPAAATDDTSPPESYLLRVGSAPGLTDLAVFDTRSLDTAFAVSGAPNGRFFVRVLARNRFGESAESNEVIVQVGPVPCTVPPDVVATLTHTVAGLSTQLTWSPTLTADSYVLEAGSVPGAANLLVANVGNITTLGATAGAGTYYVRVRGANNCGVGPASNEATVVLGGPVVPPNAPTNLQAAVDAARNVTISWAGPTSGGTPAFYVLEAGYAPGASNAAVAPTTATSLFAPGVPAGTYYLRVRGANSAGAGPATAEVTLTVP